MFLLPFIISAFAAWSNAQDVSYDFSRAASQLIAVVKTAPHRGSVRLNSFLLKNSKPLGVLPVFQNALSSGAMSVDYSRSQGRLNLTFRKMKDVCLFNVDLTSGETLFVRISFSKEEATLSLPLESNKMDLKFHGLLAADGVELTVSGYSAASNYALNHLAAYTVNPLHARIDAFGMPDELNVMPVLDFASSQTTQVACQ